MIFQVFLGHLEVRAGTISGNGRRACDSKVTISYPIKGCPWGSATTNGAWSEPEFVYGTNEDDNGFVH
jgi:hypothetical protein